MRLVGRSRRVRRRRNTEPLVRRVEHGVEPLEEHLAVDEVEPRARVRAGVVHDEVHVVRRAADVRVERARPDLAVGRERERAGADRERQARERRVLRRREAQQAGRAVERGAGRGFVLVERVRGDLGEGKSRPVSDRESARKGRLT
jgi:hypothetical protein